WPARATAWPSCGERSPPCAARTAEPGGLCVAAPRRGFAVPWGVLTPAPLAASLDVSRGTCLLGLALIHLLLGTACRGNNLAAGLARTPEIDAQGQSRCGVMK